MSEEKSTTIKMVKFNRSIFFPAIVMSLCLLYYFANPSFSKETYEIIHQVLFIISGITIVIMSGLHVLSAVMSVSVVIVNYLVINMFRYSYSEDYVFSSGYNIWIMFLFPTFLLSIFLFEKRKTHKYWSWFYIFLLSETMIIERLQKQILTTDSYYFYKHIGMFNYPALQLAILSIIILFIYYIGKGKNLIAMALFSTISLCFSIYKSDDLFSFSLFSLVSVLIILITSGYGKYYSNYKDEELDIANYKSYCVDAAKKYPLKYTISLLYIDEYLRLSKRFGLHRMSLLKKMIIREVQQIYPEVLIYTYKKDSFILAFLNANAKDSFEKAEEIRRQLAKSVFIFNENNHLQLTVSQCISEEKRSDANATAVLNRAEKNLEKACRFTRNVTVKA